MPFFKLGIFYLSWLFWPALVLCLWVIWRAPVRLAKVGAAVILLGLTILAYARFVEPRLLFVHEHKLELCREGVTPERYRLAVFADTHNGLFPHAMPLERIVSRVNAAQPDIVLIPGDLTYHPHTEDIPRLMAPLAGLEAPTIAVMGNHDEGYPGPDLSDPLTAALIAHGVTVLNPDNHIETLPDGREILIQGLADVWAYENGDVPLLKRHDGSHDGLIISLEHNPRVISMPGVGDAVSGPFDLMITGHTHGGQIYLPGITCTFTFACDYTRHGFVRVGGKALFVTAGTGMVGLPMRFMVPPSIDVLDIELRPCASRNGDA